MSTMLGWETSLAYARPSLRGKEDVLVLFVHWNFVKKNMKSLGLANTEPPSKPSELLPDGWNDAYSIRYEHNGEKYELHVTFNSGSGIFNLLHNDDVKTLSINVDVVKSMQGDIEVMIPTYLDMIRTIEIELISGVSNEKDKETQTDPESAEPVKTQPLMNRTNPLVLPHPSRDLPDIGGRDLNPFGVGGGMVFDPRSGFPDPFSIDNPRGRFPGARFDPYGPPGLRFPGNEHRPPPGFDDDMFS